MSLILDALNRAEQERKRQDQVPDIHTIHLAPAVSLGRAARNRRRLQIAGALVLLVVIIALVVWLLRSPQPAQPQVVIPAPVQAPVVQPAVVHTAPAPVVQTPAPQVEPITETASSESVATVTPEPDAVAADINNLYATANKEAEVPSPVAELYQEKVPEESESVKTPFPDMVPELVLPVAELRSLDAFPNLPFFNDLPWTQKQEIPTISYSRHNYLPNAVSSVVINGATRGIGNLAPGEFIIEDIVSDGVVLRYKDKVFKLPALSGWVNM